MKPLRYASVCSGIEAASVAWQPLGFAPVLFSEIEAFPNAVLAHHYPEVPNLGDLTAYQSWPDANFDVLIGGTPCQSFSVAGLRAGLADPRGNLTLVYLGVVARFRPRWICWENVPGVLSDRTNAFGHFLAGLSELGYGWAYRVLDAQYFGVPQRRRRVFVVGHSGGWQRAAAVLFERESLSWYPPPRRETGESVALPLTSGVDRGGEHPRSARQQPHPGGYTLGARSARSVGAQDAAGGHIVPEIANSVGTKWHSESEDQRDTVVVAPALKADGFDASEDGTGRGTPLTVSTLTSNGDAHSGFKDEAGLISFAIGSHAGVADGDQSNRSHESGGPVGSNISEELAYSVRSGRTQSVGNAMAVRRLTPRECERLQGLPDDYTLIPYRNKPAADGPRYKALGNSMAVPVVRWIGERLAMVDAL